MVWARQASQDCHTTAATTATLNWPAAPTAGRHSFMLVTATGGAANSINTPAGWTVLARVAIGNQTTDGEIALFGRASAPAETAVIVTATGTINVYGVEYSGGSLTIDVQNTGAPNAANVFSQVTGSITTTDAADLVLVGVGLSASGGGGVGAVWATATNLLANQENKIFLGERIPGATVTYQDTATWTTGRHAVGLIVALRAGTTAVSDTDSAAATDDFEQIAAAVSQAETATATDAESASAAVSNAETASATDAESVASTVTNADSAAATDSESAALAATETDTAAASDAESAAIASTDADTAAGSDAESISLAASETDSGLATDAESAALAMSDSDTGSAADAESAGLAFTDDDPASATDAEQVAQLLANDDSALVSELESVLAGVAESDLALIIEGQAVVVFVTQSDSAAVSEDQSVSTGAPDLGWLVGASFL